MVKSLAARRTGSSAIRDLLALTERPEVVSLAGGLPSPETFPVSAVGAAWEALVSDGAASALQYGPTEGHRPLREWVADHLAPAGPGVDGVQITSGAQQALDLTFRALVDPGDLVAVGEVAYVGARQALRATGAATLPVPVDDDGLCVDALGAALAEGARPRAVYVVSTFDNPTGATLSAARRRALGDLADRYGFWIVDDDPYGALRWAGAAPTPLRATSDRTITVGTTSKVLCPGLRVGWVAAPEPVRLAVTHLKQAADLHTSSLDQRIVAGLVHEPGLLDRQVARARELYEQRCRALVSALDRHLGCALELRAPDGGLFVWARLADGVAPGRDATGLLEAAIAEGVAFVPGGAFGEVDGPASRHLRLSFAGVGVDDLEVGAARLARAIGHR